MTQKYFLGDLVKYSNKQLGLRENVGTIIAMNLLTGDTLVDFGIKPNYRWQIGAKSIRPKNPAWEFLPYEFKDTDILGYAWSKSDACAWVMIKSRNLKSAEIPYDPEQQGDTEDDI